jgi:phenylalanyl-tRNA synthetase beta chain
VAKGFEGGIMPKIDFSLDDLRSLLKKNIPYDELEERGILFVKGEIEGFMDDNIIVDIKDTNRPDLWSVEGIARELRGHYGVSEGLPEFKIKSSGISMNVDKKVEKVRAKTVGAVVKGLTFDDEFIKQMIQLQEKIHMTYGRNRGECAIGVYDFDRIVPPVRYTTVAPDGIKFVPLDFEEEMTPGEILEKHPKGREYAHLIDKHDEYPLMIDSEGNVLSIPPIINSVYTGKVSEETKNVFIEMTGHDVERLSVALNVLAAAFYDRGGEVLSVDVNYPDGTIVTPDLTPKEFTFKHMDCRKLLGLDLTDEEIISLLKKARYDVIELKSGKVKVKYPAYRNDIMHQRDVIEDIAIAYDINNIEPEPPEISTIGGADPKEEFSDTLREVMLGLGFQEVLTFSLINKENLFDKMNQKEGEVCEIANPVSTNWNAIRSRLLPSIMDFLRANLHVEYPQKVFEVGDVVVIDESAETGTKTEKKLACALSDMDAGYEDISSILNAVLRSIGLEYSLKNKDHESFISGRSAEIVAGGKSVGMVGEIHPQVLNNWGIEKPVAVLEIDIENIK